MRRGRHANINEPDPYLCLFVQRRHMADLRGKAEAPKLVLICPISNRFVANVQMPIRLPVKLKKEPLVEVVCQIHVAGVAAVNTYFPGLLLAKHQQNVSEFHQLPLMSIPEELRAAQPEMAFMPLVQLKFKGVLVLVGERSISISNPAPYVGWATFKAIVVEAFTVLLQSNLVSRIERYSLKYLDVVKINEVSDSSEALAWTLEVGKLKLNKQATMLRTETVSADGLVTIITLRGGVIVQTQGQAPVEGSLIDTDTICQNQFDVGVFIASMPDELDRVHRVNKEVFFGCLTEDAINALDPVYE